MIAKWKLGAGLAALIGGLVVVKKAEAKKKISTSTFPTPPASGGILSRLTVGLTAPAKPKGGMVPIAPPGVPQTPGVIAPPSVSAPAGDPVHSAAAALLQYLNSNPPTQGAFAACS